MKRFLYTLGMTIVCLVMPQLAIAAEDTSETELKEGDSFVVDGMTYKVMSAADKTCELTNGKDKEVVLSPEVNYNGISYTLVSIGASAFAGYNSLLSIEIPYSVTTIGSRAFRRCSQLKSLTIVESTSQVIIGTEAFEYCTNLSQVYIPNSVVGIYKQAFHYCSKIESVTVNNRNPSDIYVGSEALNHSSNCILNVPNGCKPLYEAADYWKNFSQIIEMSEFSMGETFNVDDMTYKVTSAIDKTCELTEGKGGDIVIPEKVLSYTVTSIGRSAFSSINISSIVIPSCVKEIDRYAFSGCTLPAILTIPEGVKSIGAAAFGYSKGLKCIILPSTLERLGNNAFISTPLETVFCLAKSAPTLFSTVEERFYRLSMSNIKLLCMPDSDVDSYNKNYGFDDDGAWRKFEKKIAKDWFGYIINEGIVYGEAENELYVCHVDDAIEDIIIPDKIGGKPVTGIYYDFKSKEKLKTLKFPNKMEIFDTAFGSCLSLTDVALPDNLTMIPQNMFSSCSALASINIPSEVATIEDQTFYNCKGLKNIVSRNVNPPTLQNNTFYGVDKQNCVLRVPYESLDKYKETDFWKDFQVVKSIEGYELVKVAEIQLSEGECTINKGENHQLIAAILPDNADDKTLKWTSSNTAIATVDADGNVTAIDEGTATITVKANDDSGVSASCKVIVIVPYCDSPIFALDGKTLTIGSTTPVTTIYYTIGGAEPTEASTKYTAPITLTDNKIVKAIAYAENHLPSTVSSFTPELDHTSITFYVANEGKKIGYKSLSSTTCQVLANNYSGDVVIPEEVTYNENTYKVVSIGGSAFKDCASLTSVVMPNTVTSICDDAFLGCSSLKKIVMPKSLILVGDNIFAGCFITSLTCSYPYETDGVSLIDSRTKTLDSYYNGNIEKYSVPTEVKTIRKWGFYKWEKLKVLTLPEGLETIEYAILLDCYNVEFINIPSTVTYIGNRIFEGPRNVEPSVLISVADPKQITLQASPFNNTWVSWNLFVPEGSVDAYKNATQWIKPDYNMAASNKVYESKFSEYNYNNNYKQCKLQYEIIPGKACRVISVTEPQSSSIAVDIKQTASYADRMFDVTEIGESAFEKNAALYSIILSDNIKVIGSNAFNGCYGLCRMESQSEVPPIVESVAFTGILYKCVLKVPFESIEAYKSADGWKEFNKIEGIVSPVTDLVLNETKITIGKGKTYQLKAEIIPSFADNKTVIWSSNNTSVATVNSDGIVTAINAGEAVITVKSNYNPEITAMCNVNVIIPICETPIFVQDDDRLAISCSTANSTIYYTIDGAEPTNASTKYTAPITLTDNRTIKAIAYADNHNPSSVANYTPTGKNCFSCGNVNITVSDSKATLTSTTNGAAIYYTLDGTTPTTASTKYVGPITLTYNCTIKAIAIKEYMDDSPVTSCEVNTFIVATPTFLQNGDELTVSCATTGATVYYTIGGEEPKNTSTLYSVPITLIDNRTIKAIAYKDGYNTSGIASFTPNSATCQQVSISVSGTTATLTCTTSGATIYYTLDGTTPTTSSSKYTSPITLTRNCTIKAVAIKAYMNDSEVASYNVNTFTVATPSFSQSGDRLTISCATDGATIYYTIGGAEPTNASTKYTGPISIADNRMIKAIAYKEGYNTSAVASYSPNSATCSEVSIVVNGTTATLTCATDGATIHYTLDGTNPTASSSVYTSPITLTRNCTIKAIAMKENMNDSPISSYSVCTFTTSTPTFSMNGDKLTICCATNGATIYYTIGGAEPTNVSTRYTGPITISDNRMVKAIAYTDGFNPSSVASYTPNSAACQKVAISVSGTKATLTCATSGATIYYTLDGTTPTASSSVYSSPITLTHNCTIKAVAMKENLNDSEVTSYNVSSFRCSDVTMSYDGRMVSLSSGTDGAVIYYTIDGSTPTAASAVYTKPFDAGGIVTVKAIATKVNWNDCEVMEEKLPCYSDGRVAWVDESAALDKALSVGTEKLAAVVWNVNAAVPSNALAGIDNPNLLLYVKMRSYGLVGINNVVVDNQAERIELADDGCFFVPIAFTAKRISYTHCYRMSTPTDGSAAGWETLALPFDVQSITHESHGAAAPFATNVAGTKPFWLYTLGENGWVKATGIKANTPYIICMPNNEAYADDYILAGDVTFSAENANVPTTNANIAQSGDKRFVPTTMAVGKSTNVFVINRNEKCSGTEPGSMFVSDLRTVSPFEAYITVANTARAPHALSIFDFGRNDIATDILAIPTKAAGDGNIYTLTGVLVGRDGQTTGLASGIYIVNGKKKFVK